MLESHRIFYIEHNKLREAIWKDYNEQREVELLKIKKLVASDDTELEDNELTKTNKNKIN